MKGLVHQIYCTHCTYGTSAVEKRQGEMADRVLGYGARAASLEAADLRKNYREIERFLYYTLSVDSPSEEKKRLTAESAPRRLVYCPAIGNVKMLGQMSYRQTDTAGRPGSYFGHVLIADKAETWSVLDCLQTWGAPWCDADSSALPFQLPTLTSVRDVRPHGRPAIDDGVLLSFVKTQAGGEFDDPHGVIPARWRAAPRNERLELLADSLRAFLQLAVDRRESLLLVVEPSVATLIFYGIARLLPPGSIRDELSFSTFEHNADRLPVTLAATNFHAPETSDLKPDAYRARGYVYNTYLKKGSTTPRNASPYAALMIDTLDGQGLVAVDAMHLDFSGAAPKKSEDLELLAQARGKAVLLLSPQAPAVTWREGVEADFLASSVRRALEFADSNSPLLAGLVGSANHLIILDLIATTNDIKTREAVRFLSLKLPPSHISAFVDSKRIADEWKLAPIMQYIHSHQSFPPNCESLWGRPTSKAKVRAAAGGDTSLLTKVIERLPPDRVVALFENVPRDGRSPFLSALLVVARNDSAKQEIISKLIVASDDDTFAAQLENHADEIRDCFGKRDRKFGERLNRALFSLADHPRQFLHRLELLKKWIEYFPDIDKAEYRLSNWRKVYAIFENVRNSAPKANAGLLEKLTSGSLEIDDDRLGWSLAETLNIAMPSAQYERLDNSVKIEFLKEFGTIVLGSSTFLSPEVWRRIDFFFETNQWSAPISRRSGGAGFMKSGGLASKRTVFIAGVSTAVVLVLGIAFMLRSGPSSVDSRNSDTALDDNSDKTSAALPGVVTTTPASKPVPTASKPTQQKPTESPVAQDTATRPTPSPTSSTTVSQDKPEAQLTATMTAIASPSGDAPLPRPTPSATPPQPTQVASGAPEPKPIASATSTGNAPANTSAPVIAAQPSATVPQQLASAEGPKPLLMSATDSNVANRPSQIKAVMPYRAETRFQFKPLPSIGILEKASFAALEAGNDSLLRLIQPSRIEKKARLTTTTPNGTGQLDIFSDSAGNTNSETTGDSKSNSLVGSTEHLATFKVVNGSLSFEWHAAVSSGEHRDNIADLRECVLEIAPRNKGKIFIALYDPIESASVSFSTCESTGITKNDKKTLIEKLPPFAKTATVIIPTTHRRFQADEFSLGSVVGSKEATDPKLRSDRIAFARNPQTILAAKTTWPSVLILRSPNSEWVKDIASSVSLRVQKPATNQNGNVIFDIHLELKQTVTEASIAGYKKRASNLVNAKNIISKNEAILDKDKVVEEFAARGGAMYLSTWKDAIDNIEKYTGLPKPKNLFPLTDTPDKIKENARIWHSELKSKLLDPTTNDSDDGSVHRANEAMLAEIEKQQGIICDKLNEVSSLSAVIYRRVGDFEVPEIVIGDAPAIQLNSKNQWVEKQ